MAPWLDTKPSNAWAHLRFADFDCMQHVVAVESFLLQMWVAPDYRGLGIGMALVDRIKNWAYKKDVENLVLSVTTINTGAIALYKKLGFYRAGDSEQLRVGSKLKSQTMEITLNRADL